MKIVSVFLGLIFIAGLSYFVFTALEVREDIQLVTKEVKAEREKISPYNYLDADDIRVYSDRVELNVAQPSITAVAKTHSMDPLIDNDTHIIQITPKSPDDIHIGDIVSYRSKYADGVIVHRIIGTGEDEQGWFAELKGDNNLLRDPGFIRFDQIEKIGIIIVY